ncbi:class I SAM-dependent methyltransferase [Pontixanthobacter gangjinensis]|uniref:Methyltransferase domain-containing protein n=1 Tax=Pontixanthobacter gangjinensis TaxID=1028742 RepID=A0A6I4SM08_9SPHN|nr:class I SAM-dependent methyltransferase [Pontixanthobacter gangjinensis]MXO56704.1 methyltransferase domain-containing protein [Pontixanthobacter gangjinensis]
MSDAATIAFYEANAALYTEKFGQRPSPHLDPFLDLLEPRAAILELGCGSGQDSARIVERGFDLDATDGSQAMVAKTKELRGIDAKLMRFEEISAVNAYDAVWAHACLIHVARNNFHQVLSAIHRSLRPEGLHFANYKLGAGEGRDPLGRLHNFPNENWLENAYVAAGFTNIESGTYRGEGADGVIRDWFALTVRKLVG